MYRRLAQKWMAFAFDANGDPVTGISPLTNITAKISKDGADAVALGTPAATNELEAGYYSFTLTAAETDAEMLTLIPTCSSPAGTYVVGSPATIYTMEHVISGECTTFAGTSKETVVSTLQTTHSYTTANALTGRVLIFDADTTTAALKNQAGEITGYTTGGVLSFAANTFTVDHSATDTFKIY